MTATSTKFTRLEDGSYESALGVVYRTPNGHHWIAVRHDGTLTCSCGSLRWAKASLSRTDV